MDIGEQVKLIDECTCDGNCNTDSHSCPYEEEINDNYNDFCNCCDYCTKECANDI